jgi:hypothetical protein
MSSSSSDNEMPEITLITGAGSADPDVVATFRVGDNSMRPDGVAEFTVVDRARSLIGAGPLPGGHITWDASYDGTGEFFSVAPVRLRIDSGRISWSVGTADFITSPVGPYRRIAKVQVLAAAAGDVWDGLVQWDSLQVTFRGDDGRAARHASPCLPKAWSRATLRRASFAGDGGNAGAVMRQQFAEIISPRGTVGFELKGQVTLRAVGGSDQSSLLSADALLGKVLVFTE